MMKTKLFSGFLTAFALILGSVSISSAAVPVPPELASAKVADWTGEPRNSADGIVARVEVFSKTPKVQFADSEGAFRAWSGLQLGNNDLLYVPEDSRCRITLGSGDIIHLGQESLVGFIFSDNGTEILLWNGNLVAYAMPSLQGRSNPLKIQTPGGMVELKAAKIGLTANYYDNLTTVRVFENRVLWIADDGVTTILPSGVSLTAEAGEYKRGHFNRAMEVRWSAEVSPEALVAQQGIRAYSDNNPGVAREILQLVQLSFPYNAAAAYYLGQINLEDKLVDIAIKQWQLYVKIDPEGAEEKGIPKHLTLLMAENLKKEIKEALANEAAVSNADALPNSIGVPPLVNKGSKKYDVLSKGLTAMIISDLAKVPTLKILERAKMDKLVAEIGLSQQGLIDQNSQIKAGNLLKAEKLVVGDYAIGEPEAGVKLEKPSVETTDVESAQPDEPASSETGDGESAQ
jgi:hypothetical protein